jgi:hypothetical protein
MIPPEVKRLLFTNIRRCAARNIVGDWPNFGGSLEITYGFWEQAWPFLRYYERRLICRKILRESVGYHDRVKDLAFGRVKGLTESEFRHDLEKNR